MNFEGMKSIHLLWSMIFNRQETTKYEKNENMCLRGGK